MNILDWYRERLNVRIVLFPCYINAFGETFPCKIHLHSDHKSIDIKFTTPNKEHNWNVFLSQIVVYGTSMFVFDEFSNCGRGTLIIPAFSDDEDELDDE